MRERLAVFPDTNIFLHYPPLSQIDWRTACDAEEVLIVVCMEVVHELDRKKSDALLTERASRAIKEIREFSDSAKPVRHGVTLMVFTHEPRREDFAGSLSPDRGDDTIIHLVKEYSKTSRGTEIALVTEDLGMELRCKVHGLNVVRLDERLRLPIPKDALTKRYQRAATELAELKSRLPNLSVVVAHQADEMHGTELKVRLVPPPLPHDADEAVARIREAHPKLAEGGLFRSTWYGSEMHPDFIPDDEIARYNRELESFYDQHKQYVELRNIYDEGMSRAFHFSLTIKNSGKGPASDMRVTISFPDSVVFLASRDSDEAREIEAGAAAPNPPKAPRKNSDLWLRSDTWARPLEPLFDPSKIRFRTANDEPDVEVTGTSDKCDFRIVVSLGRAIHTREYPLGEFIAILKPGDAIGTFGVKYVISTAEHPDLIDGKLLFHFLRETR